MISSPGDLLWSPALFFSDTLHDMETIYVFGNTNLEIDSLPIRLAPKLRKTFPNITFTILDPNEEWVVPKRMIIIDTVVGITEPTVFEDLDIFMKTPRVTCHDFDAYTNLQFLKKLGKIESVFIIGLPPGISEDSAMQALTKTITSFQDKVLAHGE